jgi:hypothetical protein
MRRQPNQQPIAWFWDIHNRSLLDLDPPYQRRSVWNQAFKDLFIDTILLEYPAPAIFLFEEISPEGIARYHVVDGKQRLITIFSFLSNEFPVPENAEITALRGRYFRELDDETKRKFWTYQFSIEYLQTDDESLINSVFDRINRNTARLSAQELRHAKFGGEFISTAEELAVWMTQQLPLNFPNITPRSRNQMKDVELVALLLLLLEEGPRSYSTLQLDEAFAVRDSEWTRKGDISDSFRETIKSINTIIAEEEGIERTRLKNQADFYSLFGAVGELLKEGGSAFSEAGSSLRAFLQSVEDESQRTANSSTKAYYDAARSASSDAGPRRTRIQILKELLAAHVS